MSYTPKPLPEHPRILREFKRIALALQIFRPKQVVFVELNSEPERPEEGMMALADGTNWDPGSGAGLYIYLSGWKKFTVT